MRSGEQIPGSKPELLSEDGSRSEYQKMGSKVLETDAAESVEGDSANELLEGCSEALREKWGHYETELAEAKERYISQEPELSYFDKDQEVGISRADYERLEKDSRSLLRSVSDKDRQNFSKFLTMRYAQRKDDSDMTGMKKSTMSDLSLACENYDPMLKDSMNFSMTSVLRTDGSQVDEALKLPARAFIETLTSEEREALGVDAEKKRLKRVDEAFGKVLNRVDPNLYDVAWRCRDLAMDDDQEGMALAYATIAYYSNPSSDINKDAFLDKMYSDVEYKYHSNLQDEDFAESVDFNSLVDEDIVYNLPDDLEKMPYYNDLQRILHEMHQLNPRLHSEAMLGYAKLSAAMALGEGEGVFYTDDGFIPGSIELGLNGKNDVPQELVDFLHQIASRYKDVAVTNIQVDWTNSHLDFGDDYDYSLPEAVSYELASTRPEEIDRFKRDVEAEGEAAVAKILEAQKEGKKAKFKATNW